VTAIAFLGLYFCQQTNLPSIASHLSTARFFNRLDNDSLCLFTGQVRDGQVRDGLSAAGLFFRIDGNLGNLYCDSWRGSINNCNLSFLFPGQGTPPTHMGSPCYENFPSRFLHFIVVPACSLCEKTEERNYVMSCLVLNKHVYNMKLLKTTSLSKFCPKIKIRDPGRYAAS
jgi:hypothetical protein